MAEPAGRGAELFHGLPCLNLALSNGDSVRVLHHGAQVVSWIASGRERLYLSPRSKFDGHSAIRGGVPICFPQFNQRGALPKHGFARNLPWQVDAVEATSERARLTLRLRDSAATRQFWPQAFEAMLTVELWPGRLQLTLGVHNTGAIALSFSGALHTYLAVADISTTELTGLEGQAEWDALTDRHAPAAGSLRFQGEFDRVYAAAPRALRLREGGHQLAIEQSATWAQTVVWNPGAEPAGRLADLPAEGYARMLCVEAAQVTPPITVAPGAAWQGWQRLTVR